MPSIGYKEQDDMKIMFINFSKDYNSNKLIVVTEEKAEELYETYKSMVVNGKAVCISLNETLVASNGEIVQGRCVKCYSNFSL